jgi:CheY-like chemotaxis protein
VVDDLDVVRFFFQALLRQAGFAVFLAAGGREALELYQEHWQDIGLVLLDVKMVGWDGLQTLGALQAVNPAVRCCFVTGDAGGHSEEQLLAAGALRVFAKPVQDLHAFCREVAELLAGPSLAPGQKARR